MTHIPYKGSAQATTDLLSGQVTVSFPGIAGMIQHIKNGRLRALAVTSVKRSPQMPEVPSIAEAGVKGYEASLWLGILAPAALPKDINARLNAAVGKILKQPELQTSFRAIGTEIVYRAPQDFGKFVKSELGKWARVVKETGMQVN